MQEKEDKNKMDKYLKLHRSTSGLTNQKLNILMDVLNIRYTMVRDFIF